MSTHIADELPRLLTGEATRDEVMAAAAHLRTCPDCQQELVSAVVAHSSLTSAQRFAPEIIAFADEEASTEQAAGKGLPDLSSVFEHARAESAAPPARSGHPRRLAAAAAIAGLVIGGGAAVAADRLATGSSSPAGTTVALAAFGVGTHSASARVANDRMTVDAASLPRLGADQRYEVWLTNAKRTAMQPVGWIDTDGRATLTVPQTLMAKYSAIEVSVQKVDAPTYDYSGTSVLRGSYS